MEITSLNNFIQNTGYNKLKSKKPYEKRVNDGLKTAINNNHIRKNEVNFKDFSNNLVLKNPFEEEKTNQKETNQKESFNFKNALKPLAILTGGVFLAGGLISGVLNKYSKVLATKEGIVRPPDLARNVNIVEEPHFAMYRALRDPNFQNILGFGAVAAMSGLTLIGKNFVEGASEIWQKKQNCKIERDLQENLIEVEKNSFSGKINYINSLLKDTSSYFANALGQNQNNFQTPLTFNGNKNNEEENDDKKFVLGLGLATLGIFLTGIFVGSNFLKTAKNLENFKNKNTDLEIKSKIQAAIENKDKSKAIKNLTNLLKQINATSENAKAQLEKIQGITDSEVKLALDEIDKSKIYAQTPEALGGISEKIQYYCYMNEERGHLYNWVLNPENKFNKYLFLAFSLVSSIGFLAKTTASAIKNVTVAKENSKSELDLRKKLVDVEIENFKAKKQAAISPLMDDFNQKLNSNSSKENLEEMAQDILFEIKNGPPYVYS